MPRFNRAMLARTVIATLTAYACLRVFPSASTGDDAPAKEEVQAGDESDGLPAAKRPGRRRFVQQTGWAGSLHAGGHRGDAQRRR